MKRLRDRLPGDPRPRAAAADAFRRAGLPGATSGRREEAWKYTSLRPVADATFQQPVAHPAGDSRLLARLPPLEAPRIVFVDGEFRPELSALPASLDFARFADRAEYGRLARPDSEPLVALNTMLAEDGALLSVPDGVDAGLLLLVSVATDRAACHPRHLIHLARGARLSLLELSFGDGSYLHNPVLEVVVGDDAALTHVRLQNEAPTAFHLSTVYAEIGERGDVRQLRAEPWRPHRAHRGACQAGRYQGHCASERRTVAWRHAARRLHDRGEARRAVVHIAPDGQERPGGTFAGRVPGPDRGRTRRAEDRRLPDEPGAAAVAGCRRSTPSRNSRSSPTM